MMKNRINQLEANLEEKISANIETTLKTHIEKEIGRLIYFKRLKGEKVKQELKDDMVTMNLKIDNVQKSCENLILEKKDENSIDIRYNVIIKNLAYDEREKDSAKVAMNKVQTLFRDGLSIPNVKIQKVTRKNGNERYNGVVVVQLEDNE